MTKSEKVTRAVAGGAAGMVVGGLILGPPGALILGKLGVYLATRED